MLFHDIFPYLGVSIVMGVPQKLDGPWENPIYKWMTTGGTSMTQETSIFHDIFYQNPMIYAFTSMPSHDMVVS